MQLMQEPLIRALKHSMYNKPKINKLKSELEMWDYLDPYENNLVSFLKVEDKAHGVRITFANKVMISPRKLLRAIDNGSVKLVTKKFKRKRLCL